VATQPHTALILNQYAVIVGGIVDITDAVTKEYYQRVTMTHTQQLETFGWCICEDKQGHIGEGCDD
jgi:hypothetical protein